jgi:hypothetical protein
MRKAQIITLTAALALALTTAAGGGTSGQATVRFIDLIPVKVRGAHFIPREDVRVTLRAGDAKRLRTAPTSASGAFTVDFGTLRKKDRCSGSVAVVAVGDRGDRAAYRLPPMACPTAAAAERSE